MLVDLFREGMFSPAVQIHVPGSETQPAIIAPIREWPCAEFSVWGITVRATRFRTSGGLGVGSTLADLRKTYKAEVGWGEGERIAHVAAPTRRLQRAAADAIMPRRLSGSR